MTRKLFASSLIITAIFLSAVRYSFTEQQNVGGQWRGLNTGDASIQIGDNEAQDLNNVDITDSGYGIKKRAGTAQFKTLSSSTWGVRGGYFFKDASGNNTIVHANAKSIYKSVNSSSYSAFISTQTDGAYYDFSDSQGSLWAANSSRDVIISYTGSVLTSYSALPQGNQLEFLPDRLAISGTTANPNRVHFSKASDPTTFTVGAEESDPFTEDFGLPGQAINAIKWADDRLLVWTKTNTSFWSGSTQYDGLIQEVSPTIGCVQPNSIIRDFGITYWQAQDGHFYAYDNNAVVWLSKSISQTITDLAAGVVRSWTLNSESDFESGTVASTLDTNTNSGSVSLSTGVYLDDFSDGQLTSPLSWSTYTYLASASYFGVVNSQLKVDSGNIGGLGLKTQLSTVYSTGSFKWSITLSSAGSLSQVGFQGHAIANGTVGVIDGGYSVTFYPFGVSLAKTGSTLTTVVESFTVGQQYSLEFNRTAAGVLTVAVDNVAKIQTTDTTYSTFTYINVYTSDTGNSPILFDNFYFFPSAGIYQSPSFNLTTVPTSFSNFDVDQSVLAGSLSYTLYVDTNTSITITDPTTFVSSQSINPGATPSLTPNSYVAWSAAFSRNISTQNPTINAVSVAWNEGTVSRTFGVVDKNHRLMWSVAESTQTTPNITLIYDPRFDTWLKYSIPFDAAVNVDGTIYYGGPSTGVVYIYPSGNTDNTAAFQAYWKSKDFTGDPFVEKDYTAINLVAKTQTGSNLDLAYTINTSSTISNNLSLTDANGNSFVRHNRYLPSGTFGTFFNFQFGNDDADAPFEVYIVNYSYKPRPWRVMP